MERESLIEEKETVDLPTEYGNFKLISFEQKDTKDIHLALKKGDWTKEDEDFYKKFVEDADEGVRNNIQILKPSWEEFKRVKRRMKYHWAELKD